MLSSIYRNKHDDKELPSLRYEKYTEENYIQDRSIVIASAIKEQGVVAPGLGESPEAKLSQTTLGIGGAQRDSLSVTGFGQKQRTRGTESKKLPASRALKIAVMEKKDSERTSTRVTTQNAQGVSTQSQSQNQNQSSQQTGTL